MEYTRSALCALLLLSACGADEPECLNLAVDCTPLYTPTFDEIHARTIAPSCALAGGACHASEGGRGGLAMSDIEGAYSQLLLRVEPGSAACSPLIVRLESSDPNVSMPPGRRLPDAERCAIAKWIEMGALR